MARKRSKTLHNVHVQVDGKIWADTLRTMKATGVRFHRDAVEKGLRLFVETNAVTAVKRPQSALLKVVRRQKKAS